MFTITNVNVYPVSTNEKLKAFVSIELDDAIVIKGIRVIEGARGLFVAMPASKDADGKYWDDVFPTTKEAREAINEVVIECYNEETKPAEKPVKKYTKKK